MSYHGSFWTIEHSEIEISPELEAWLISFIENYVKEMAITLIPGDSVTFDIDSSMTNEESKIYLDLHYGHEIDIVTGRRVATLEA